jgi:transposase
MTRTLLWEEYRMAHEGEGLSFSQYCELYRNWARGLSVVMRQEHRAGEKLFVDYAGDTVTFWDKASGEYRQAHLFVAVMGASNYTFARMTLDETRASWLECHVAALEYFGGVPEQIVPDNPRALVSRACIYDPDLNPAYVELARHYGTAVLPARPKKPRDKAIAEVAVQVAQRWIIARLRHETFYTLPALNERIGELLEALNAKPMRHYGGASRRDLFERLERPSLGPLPREPFEYADWLTVGVNIDYHVAVDHHFYSVPHTLVPLPDRERLDVRLTATVVEIFHRGQRVATHRRSFARGRHTTLPAHMPKAHQAHAGWRPSRFVDWATTIGPQTAALVTAILADRPHPEQGYRSCLGILRLAKRYDAARLEAACGRALTAGARSYRHVAAILKRGLDRLPAGTPPAADPVVHENIRGRDYYH